MKILHVIASVFKAGGGTSEVVPRLCEALVEAGHEVRLVTGRSTQVSDAAVHAREHGVDVRYMPTLGVPGLPHFCLSSRFREAIVEGVKWADIVHLHGIWQDVSWYTPYVARRMSKPYVMQTHGFLEPERLKKGAFQKKLIGLLFERPNLNRAGAVIATASSEKDSIERFSVAAPIAVVPIGLDGSPFDRAISDRDLLARMGLDTRRKTILFFSRIAPIKGLDMLARAWESLGAFHKEWQLCIAGPDHRGYLDVIRLEFERRIKDDSVVFSGPIYGNDKYSLLKSVDGFVLPTRSENFSIAVLEALAAGLPVVCTKGAPWGVVQADGAGFWVDIDVASIANGLRNLMELDSESRSAMSRAARRIADRDFAWPAISARQCEVYEGVLKALGKDSQVKEL